MYPIDCFTEENTDKIEAVRYYIYLNKEFLKDTSREDYDNFIEFLKGVGKDILIEMSKAETNKELYTLLKKLEKGLPYKTALTKYSTLEDKINAIHKKFAKNLFASNKQKYSSTKSLVKQRELAEEYDNLQFILNSYKTNVREYNQFKSDICNENAIKQIFANKTVDASIGEMAEALKNAIDKYGLKVKESRNEAFDKIKQYNLNEQVYVLNQEENTK